MVDCVGDDRPSSLYGKVMPPARVFNALAKDDVLLRVFETPSEMVLVIVSDLE
jgi:hypothetical protein